MRHAARAPPPPFFEDRRLVQQIAVQTSEFIDWNFAIFLFAYVCSYLLVLDVFRKFDSWSAALVVCEIVARNVANMMLTDPEFVCGCFIPVDCFRAYSNGLFHSAT